ncbi:LOW QUALITY PROTEIN: tRNA pseudouridine(38/39) synthase [Drosophila nasuta]|uniref:LOW QUALITY PROTEIN: tRNA pseudouridine(38/39) synthase n=1 Tax=Drosophila nasuta TaxID=42062 RepID=UPI00295E38E0|nr:LOW QUALITY PROTEIN: tRNA pseudouridine(38/39) synthase [Drosophila nasuta]
MSQKVVINKRLKGLSPEALNQLSKAELVDKIVQLEAYNFQLKNLLQKKLTENDKNNAEYKTLLEGESGVRELSKESMESEDKSSSKRKKQRMFDWSSAHRRHVLLKVVYFGWDYQGFACQEDSNDTIEAHLFRALLRTCLIESRASSNYHRCGRTDKEVSAFCQVISIDLRSKLAPEVQLENQSITSEIDYCSLLNRVLPKNIQCVSWMPLRSPVYSARFDCIARTYRYYFPKGDLNIEAMQSACQLLQRHADFRNFCKMDVHNGVTNYMRNLQHAVVKPCDETASASGYAMYFLEIKANAFLWHQIRCIMAVLLLVGQRHEQPSVISELLDVVKNPCKPQYTPAIGLPLNLFHCEFRAHTTRLANTSGNAANDAHDDVLDNDKVESGGNEPDLTDWVYSEENLQKLVENLQCEWTQFSVKCTMIRNVLTQLEEMLEQQFKPQLVQAQVIMLQDAVKPRQHQPLLQRKRCESLENRIEHFVKKQRLIVKESAETDASNRMDETS